MILLIRFLATDLIIIMILAAIILLRKKIKYYLIWGFGSYILAEVISIVIKHLHYVQRPYIALHINSLLHHPPTDGSFPSGHSLSAFLIATIVYSYNKKWGLGFYLMAILVGTGRVLAIVHYPIDIFGGAVIGILCAIFIKIIIGKIKTA